jgi:hypothetical protein
MRLVLSSFALLAVIFYEMSGGADFQPPEPPRLLAVETAASPDTETVQARPSDTPDDRVAATASLFPRQDQGAANRVIIAPAATEATREARTESAQATQVRSSLSQGLSLLPTSDPSDAMQLVSLELGASGLRQAPPAAETTDETITTTLPVTLPEPDKDLREVTGTRVNMRDGPGTIYPVVARLTLGHKVEVLSDSGTGWLRLRTLPEQQLGWISSSLVSAAGR